MENCNSIEPIQKLAQISRVASPQDHRRDAGYDDRKSVILQAAHQLANKVKPALALQYGRSLVDEILLTEPTLSRVCRMVMISGPTRQPATSDKGVCGIGQGRQGRSVTTS
jgi:hypothetical protein